MSHVLFKQLELDGFLFMHNIILPLVLIIIEILTEHFMNDGNGNFKSRQIIEKVKWRGNIES